MGMVKRRILLFVFLLILVVALSIVLIKILNFTPKEEGVYRGARLVMQQQAHSLCGGLQ